MDGKLFYPDLFFQFAAISYPVIFAGSQLISLKILRFYVNFSIYLKNLDDLSLDKAFLREFVWCFSNNCVLLRPGSAALHPLV